MPNVDKQPVIKAFRATLPYTTPILAGFLFTGMAYGIFMNASGFGVMDTMLTSLVIFAGSMQFVAVGLLLGPFDPIGALALTLMINARHLFYGISMLEKYNIPGLRRIYLIFGMCDETFSISCTTQPPEGVDRDWFMFFVTLENHVYWVLGSTLGAVFGDLLTFSTKGLDFVMTALFVVIFLEQWLGQKNHSSSLIGLGLSALCLAVFGRTSFLIPAMLLIWGVLTLLRRPLEKAGDPA